METKPPHWTGSAAQTFGALGGLAQAGWQAARQNPTWGGFLGNLGNRAKEAGGQVVKRATDLGKETLGSLARGTRPEGAGVVRRPPAPGQAPQQPVAPAGNTPQGMPPGFYTVSDRSGLARQHANAMAYRDELMGQHAGQIEKANQQIGDIMRGNAERVGRNKERMARVMAAQAGQAGQIAQAQAMAMAAQANANAQMNQERMKNARVAEILRHIGNDRYSF